MQFDDALGKRYHSENGGGKDGVNQYRVIIKIVVYFLDIWMPGECFGYSLVVL